MQLDPKNSSRARGAQALSPWFLIASLGALGACTGTIEGTNGAPGPGSSGAPGVTATGATGSSGTPGASAASGSSSVGSATGGDPSAAPGTLSVPFTRLTRAEYRATIQAAFNLDPDVSGIPDDNRVGPFTSNVADPDPVQEFLLASEDLAAELVPAKFPTCTAATASACFSANYRTPIETLFRRALTPAEVSTISGLVSSLEGSGQTSENATRGMVVYALISSDFLFRATSLSGDAARGRLMAEHIGYALWDRPPDASLTAAGKTSTADLGAALKEQAVRLSGNEFAVPVLARFMAQWLRVDVDSKLEDPSASFATSPLYGELLAFVRNALTTGASVKSFVNGLQGFVQKNDFAAYGMAAQSSTSDVVSVPWPASSIRRGILGEELFLDATRHPDAARRPIFRGHLIRSSFLCQTVAAPPPGVVDLNSEVQDRTTDSRCASCHGLMDPIGKAFSALDLDNKDPTPGPVVNGMGEITGSFADLPALLNAIAGSQTYATCFSRNLLGFFLEQQPDLVDAAAVADVAAVVKSGGSLADALGQVVVSLDKRSQSAVPWCTGQ